MGWGAGLLLTIAWRQAAAPCADGTRVSAIDGTLSAHSETAAAPVNLLSIPAAILELLLEIVPARRLPMTSRCCRQMAALVLNHSNRLHQLRQLCRMTVAAGVKATAAISTEGQLYSWGDGGKHRQLGQAPTSSRASTVPSAVLFPWSFSGGHSTEEAVGPRIVQVRAQCSRQSA